MNNIYDDKGRILNDDFTNYEIDKIIQMKCDNFIYPNLVKSIAPHIYGLYNVKKV